MKEFIFTWRIENLIYSWLKKGEEIVSPLFVADTLQNTAWTLRLADFNADCFEVYLKRERCESEESTLAFGYEFSCVSPKKLAFCSCTYEVKVENYGSQLGSRVFLRRRAIRVEKGRLHLLGDILTIRCRLWNPKDGGNEFGQCLGYTRLEIERILSVDVMNPRHTREKTVLIYSNKENELLISVSIIHENDGLKIEINPISTDMIKSSIFKFCAVGKRRIPYKYINSWPGKLFRDIWRAPFLKTENKMNKLNLSCEFIYSSGEETKSIEKIKPCSFKFPEFESNIVLSCVPSGKLCDCPNICKDLWDLYVNQILCDVELKTETTSFWAHKVVLCARSPVFLAMLTNDMKEKTTNCVEIKDLGNDALEKFLAFLYTDNLEESEWNEVADLYYAADKYQVERLKYICCSYFINNIDCALNVCELLMLADKHSDSHLKSKVEDYIAIHHEWIFSSSTWKEFSDKQSLIAAKTTLLKYKEQEKENLTKEDTLLSYPNAFDDFRSLYESQTLSDIVIQTSNATFPAHKAILCAGSSTLRRVIQRGTPIDSLNIEDLEGETVSRLLLFLYTDSLGDMEWDNTVELYHAADVYQIERLGVKCSCFFVKHLNRLIAKHLWQLAHEYQDANLKSLVESFIFLRDKILSKLGIKIGQVSPPKRIETRLSKRLRLENNC